MAFESVASREGGMARAEGGDKAPFGAVCIGARNDVDVDREAAGAHVVPHWSQQPHCGAL